MQRRYISIGRWLLPLVLAALLPALAQASSTADHGKLEALKGPFASAPEVEEAYLAETKTVDMR